MRSAVTIMDIARQAGVHHTTVSRVLSKDKSRLISEATRLQVLRIAREMGYRPNLSARRLATGRSGTITMAAPALLPYHSRIFNLLDRHAADRGAAVLLARVAQTDASEPDRVSNWSGDGIILVDAPWFVDGYLSQPARVPLVSLGAFYRTEVDHVGVDLYDASMAAIDHLRTMGCGRIAYAAFEGEANAPSRRRQGYLDAARSLGGGPEEIPNLRPGLLSEIRASLRDYLAHNRDVDGLLCQNDGIGAAAIRAAIDLGLEVPDDLAIVGCDNTDLSEISEPRLSTIAIPLEAMCSAAWDMLMARLDRPEEPVASRIFAPKLMVRGSSQRTGGTPIPRGARSSPADDLPG